MPLPYKSQISMADQLSLKPTTSLTQISINPYMDTTVQSISPTAPTSKKRQLKICSREPLLLDTRYMQMYKIYTKTLEA
jgi:hypothetical protein